MEWSHSNGGVSALQAGRLSSNLNSITKRKKIIIRGKPLVLAAYIHPLSCYLETLIEAPKASYIFLLVLSQISSASAILVSLWWRLSISRWVKSLYHKLPHSQTEEAKPQP
jgi:hypothetical protein